MTIIFNNLKRIFRKKSNLIFMIVIPILLNVFIISVSTREVKYTIGILDKENSKFTQQFISNLGETSNVKILKDTDDIRSLVVNSEVDCAFVFDSGFTEDMIAGKEVYLKTYAIEGTNRVEPIILSISSYISASKEIAKASKGDAEVFYKGMEDYAKKEYVVQYKNFSSDSTEEVSTAVASLGYMAFGMIFLMSFSTALILEDKISGVYDRIGTTPVSRFDYFVQHLISCFVVAVIQIVALFDILPQIIGIHYGETLSQQVELIIICSIFALVCISLGILVNRYSKNTLMAGSLTTLINLPILMLGGCLWPREVMPGYIQRIGDFMPTTWFLKAAETVLYGNGMIKAIHEILFMLVFVVIMLVLSVVIKTEKAR